MTKNIQVGDLVQLAGGFTPFMIVEKIDVRGMIYVRWFGEGGKLYSDFFEDDAVLIKVE